MSVVEVPLSQKQKKTKAVKKERPISDIAISRNVYPFVIDFLNSEPELASKIEIENKVSQLSLISSVSILAKKNRENDDPKTGFILRKNLLLFFHKIFEIILEENPTVSKHEIFSVEFIPNDLILGYIDYCFSDPLYKRSGVRFDRTSWTNTKVPIYLSNKRF